MDWISIEFIESVVIMTPEKTNQEDYLATICDQLLEMTDKLKSFTVYPHLALVRLP